MKFYNNQKGTFDLTTSIAVFLVCLIISLSVAAFHYWYFPTKYLDFKSTEIQTLFTTDSDFGDLAKDILNSRNDIAYLKLLNQNGVLEESFGNQNNLNSKKYSFNGPDNKTIIAGIKPLSNKQIDGYALLWSLIIGSSISIVLLFIIFLVSPAPDRSLRKLSEALKNAVDGDYKSKLTIDSAIKGDDEMVSIYSNFNNLIDRVFPADDFESVEEIIGEDDLDMILPEEESITEDVEEIVVSEVDEIEDVEAAQLEDQSDISEVKESEIEEIQEIPNEFVSNVETGIKEPIEEPVSDPDESLKEPGLYPDEENITEDTTPDINDEVNDLEEEVTEIITPFKPKVVSVANEGRSIGKNRNVTVLVAKVSDFESLIGDLEPSDLNSFITEYRRKASSIIAEYGGVIEALLQDEIVAIFNAPEKQKHPELRSISASVEIMQVIAELARKRKAEGKRIISGKIGLSVSSVPFYTETGIPDRIKDVVDNSRHLCENTENWKIFVSGELYDCVKEHVEVKQTKVDENFYFSVIGVEEGVLRL